MCALSNHVCDVYFIPLRWSSTFTEWDRCFLFFSATNKAVVDVAHLGTNSRTCLCLFVYECSADVHFRVALRRPASRDGEGRHVLPGRAPRFRAHRGTSDCPKRIQFSGGGGRRAWRPLRDKQPAAQCVKAPAFRKACAHRRRTHSRPLRDCVFRELNLEASFISTICQRYISRNGKQQATQDPPIYPRVYSRDVPLSALPNELGRSQGDVCPA